MLHKEQIIKILEGLGFPTDQYCLYSGTVLAMHGIREAGDIDMFVSRYFFEVLKKQEGWEYVLKKNDKEFLVKGDLDITSATEFGSFTPTFAEILTGAEYVDGYPCMNLDMLIQLKKYLSREKDVKDIRYIEEYRKNRQ
ncbi:MAG: hypothetical protein ACI83D_000315 [Planctomycetota bacterium]|jgi:hypothetical protein